ncbi:MAG: ATP-binding protein [Prevotella sp.]|nr:ATP-binding protein [Prevotella sp.]
MMHHLKRKKTLEEVVNDGELLKQRAEDLAEENPELTLLKAFNCILDLAMDSELTPDFWKHSTLFSHYVAGRMKVSPTQAVLLGLLIENGTMGRTATMQDVARYVGCRNMAMMQYQQEVDDLVKRGFVRRSIKNFRREITYIIPTALLDALNKNEAYEKKTPKCNNVIELMQSFYELTHLRYEEELSSELLEEEVADLLETNKDMPYVKALKKLDLDADIELLITHFCRHIVLNNLDCLDLDVLGYLYDDKKTRYDFCHAMTEKIHPIIKSGWVERAFDGGFESNETFRLTDRTKKILLKGIELKLEDNSHCGIIGYKKIVKKDLFFGQEVNEHIERLTHLLDDEEYQKICARLKKKGYREGFTCLFYGAPGTGKTESVMQLARLAGRDILQVNIADVKSKWVGDSEKNIKSIFDRYRFAVNNSKKAPILLFNEADAIIGNRKRDAEQAVDKMENSIQNIILQEMENLQGIMIATTNLEENMDKAFERRFLYKVKFDKPELPQRAKIWHSMMPELSEETTERLAGAYNFSGGQIENITRKCNIDTILYGRRYVTDERIEQYCHEETISKKTTKSIGFRS